MENYKGINQKGLAFHAEAKHIYIYIYIYIEFD